MEIPNSTLFPLHFCCWYHWWWRQRSRFIRRGGFIKYRPLAFRLIILVHMVLFSLSWECCDSTSIPFHQETWQSGESDCALASSCSKWISYILSFQLGRAILHTRLLGSNLRIHRVNTSRYNNHRIGSVFLSSRKSGIINTVSIDSHYSFMVFLDIAIYTTWHYRHCRIRILLPCLDAESSHM